jgi:hypothetical protein
VLLLPERIEWISRRSKSLAICLYRSASLRCTSFIMSCGPEAANLVYFSASFRYELRAAWLAHASHVSRQR